MEYALKISDLTFKYYEHGERNILENLSLSVESGKITVILGRSGCGKSTLAALSAGLYPENGGILLNGEIEIFNRKIKELNHSKRAEYLSLMFQNPDLQFCMNTLRKEIIFCLENISTPPEKMDEIIFNTASKFGMSDFLDRKFSTLSGGEKQKASLCCLMAINSKCIILDEALANIDEKSAKEIILMLKDFQRTGGTVIAIEHRAELWKDFADVFMIIDDGRKIHEFNAPVDFEIFKDTLSKSGIFGEYTIRKNCCGMETESAISLKNFGVFENGKYLIKNSNADFQRGKITAILGRSGAGKTTTFKCILKQHEFEGKIEIYGKDVKEIKERDLFSQVGIVFQNPANQFITQKVIDEIRVSMNTSITDPLYLEKISDEYNLKGFEKYSPYMLSQGQQRRLAVLSILVSGQKILLLDEPTYGQDLSSTEAIMKQLNERVERDNLTVIFITHDENLAKHWADDIFIIDEGKFIKCKR